MEAETEATETEMMDVEPHEMSHWKKVVYLVQAALQEGRRTEEAT